MELVHNMGVLRDGASGCTYRHLATAKLVPQGFPTRGHLDLPLTDPDELVAASLRRLRRDVWAIVKAPCRG